MSWWIYLEDESKNLVDVPDFIAGGIVQARLTSIGLAPVPNSKAELNVTYDYSRYFYQYLDPVDGLRWLDGKRAVDTITQLTSAYRYLPDERDGDYWASTPGNAGNVLAVLLECAKLYPNAVWRVC